MNTGYWGIAVQEGATYALSVYLKFVQADGEVRPASEKPAQQTGMHVRAGPALHTAVPCSCATLGGI